MCQKAKGHVLEASVGTDKKGRFYALGKFGEGGGKASDRRLKPKGEKIRSMTVVDRSQKKSEICAQRWREQHPGFRGQVDFVVADADVNGAIEPHPGSGDFDTIIQTFGFCSMTNPVETMKTMGHLLKKTDPNGARGGRIPLLEHGRGHYRWINCLLDGLAKGHADRFGCWWNGDIGKIVEDSGLKIVGIKRDHFGDYLGTGARTFRC